MTLDPEIAAMLPVLNSQFPRVETMTAPQLRAMIRRRRRKPGAPELVARVIERSIPGPAQELRVRIYHPGRPADGKPPIVVFAHGGGFVFCDLDTHDEFCRSMTNGLGAVVVSVDYRLAPESPWPAAAEDFYAATRWAVEHADELEGDRSCLVVAGDSAGANLAAVAALIARDDGGIKIACLAMFYPVIAADFSTESYRRYGVGFYNTRTAMQWYWDQYVPGAADRAHPYAAPLNARLTGLPPAVVVTAGCDPLRSEGDAFANALATQGVRTIHRCYDGAIHGFMTMSDLGLGEQARRQAWADIAELLTTAITPG